MADLTQKLLLQIGGDSNEAQAASNELVNKMREGFGQLVESVGKFELSMKSVAEVSAVVAGMVLAVGTAIVGLGVHGSEVNDVSEGFDRLAGSASNATAILEAMRKGVVGTIDDLKLMTDANHLLATSAITDAEDFGTLTEASRVLSREGFGTMQDMINGVSKAMETGRTRRLALMGVTVDAKGAEKDYADALGITVADLTAHQKLEADRKAILEALNKTVAEAGEQELSFAERINQAKVSIQDWFNALSQAIATSPVLATALQGISDAFTWAFGEDKATLIQTLLIYVNDFAIGVAKGAQAVVSAAGPIGTEFIALQTVLGDAAQIVDGVALAFEYLALGVAHALNIASFGKAFNEDVARISDNVGNLLVKMKERGDSLAKDEQAQKDWNESTEKAAAAIGSVIDKMQGQNALAEVLRAKMDEVGFVAGNVTHGFSEFGKALDDDEPKVTAQSKAIDKLVESLKGDSASTEVSVEAVRKLIAAHIDDYDTIQRMLDLIDKLSARHQKIPKDLEAWRAANQNLLTSYDNSISELGYYRATLDTTSFAQDTVADSGNMMAAGMYGWGAVIPDLTAHLEETHEIINNLVSSTDEFSGGMTIAGDTMYSTMIPAFTTLTAGAQGSAAAIKEALAATTKWTDGLDSTLKAVPGIIEKASEGGGGISGAITAAGANLGKNLSGSIKSSVGDMLPESMDNAIGGAIGSIAGGVGGALIGKGVTLLVSWIGGLFGNHSAQDVARDAGTSFGTTFSKATTDAIVADSKAGMGPAAAELNNLNLIVKDMGGITASNLTMLTGKYHDLFSMIQMGSLSTTQVAKQLDDGFADLAKASTDAAGVASQSLQVLIGLDKQFGTNSTAVEQYKQQQVAAAATGMAASIKISSDALATYTTLSQQTTALTADQIQQMSDAGKLYDATRIKSQQSAEAIGSALVGNIDAELQAGKTLFQAITDNQDAITGFESELTATGFSGGAAFDFIKQEAQLATDKIAGPAIASIDGFTQGLVGLSNAGQMNQSTFAGLTQQVGGTEQALVAQGYSESAVMAATQKDLQAVWELEQNYGYKADDVTQALINQGVQSGLVGEQQKSTSQQTVDALNKVVDKLDDLLHGLGIEMPAALNTLVGSAQASFGKITDAVNSVPRTIDVTVNGQLNMPDIASVMGARTEELPSFDDRPMERVTGAGFAMLHPGDMVGVPQAGMLGGGGNTYVTVQGSVWTERDLAQVIGQHMANDFSQRGGAMPLVNG